MCISRCFRRQRGITLIEQIVFIVIISVGVIGVLSTLGPSLRNSADPQVKKQQLAIAESMLAEILHQPFTYCDPDDANAGTAVLSGAAPTCAVAANDQNKGGAALTTATPSTEDRLTPGVGSQFDNVADYGNYSQVGVTDLAGNNALSNFSVSVAVTRAGATFSLPADAVLQIDVTVTGGAPDPLTLTGYRFRYAPRY